MVDIKKFNKINKKQKKSIILKALSSLVFLESALVFTAGAILSIPTIAAPIMLIGTGLSLGMSAISLQSLSDENKKNNKLIKKLGE